MLPDLADAGTLFGLRYYLPAPELRRYIASYYRFRADLPEVHDVLRADLAQLRFMVMGEGHYSFGDGLVERTPAVSLLGPTMAASRFSMIGPADVFGISILPAGWATLIRDDASSFADRTTDAALLLGDLLDDALDAMRGSLTTPCMISIADAVMRALFARAAEPSLWFTELVDGWLTGAISPSVDTLVARADLSARQVERLARRLYGAPPKLLARKYRTLRVASRLGAEPVGWQEIAGDVFYDQSHFIRDFKRFIGATPRRFQQAPSPLARLMIQRRELGGKLPTIAVIS